jgi:hypothetical protein
MSRAGPFSMMCIPVMAPLSAADELTDNLSSERTKRQRISMGNRPHASSEPATHLETGIEKKADPAHDQECRRVTPDRAYLGHVLEVHPPRMPANKVGMAAMAT